MTWSRHRLHTGDEFRAVIRGGGRSARSHVVVHLTLLTQGEEAPRVGFVVSKKIGNAVVRNRVTRRLREIVRPHLATLPPGSAVVLRALPGIDEQPFAALRTDVDSALATAERKLAARSPSVR
ncbi:ribonuclease P protein component [Brachybacterium vulturis]|uniref:Ribonuclease P protein component n=1 Tax=Brachybacterium vulturis TaxID=2017484 RepID=A0A291GJQ8_9MICO|nr:ribonuclease P protein component [Brachybacterium vulturis]ATG50569.1 ribonuclease P protein component [Brachybacterium vulturis]